MSTHIKKSSIVEVAKVLLREGIKNRFPIREEIKKRFPTYDAAIAEIDRLQDAVSRLATYKRKRGRPKSAQVIHRLGVRNCVPDFWEIVSLTDSHRLFNLAKGLQ